jgi:Holliday junction resolvasome RuvABC endonuclease subunit
VKITILSLDPGTVLGYALLHFQGRDCLIADSGTIKAETQAERLVKVWQLLINASKLADIIVFEEMIPAYNIPSDKEAAEVRGVIRLFCHTHCPDKYKPYHPSTVRSLLGTKDKDTTADFVEMVLGVRPKPDHIADACGVGMAHADGGRPRTECLWISPTAQAGLQGVLDL